MKRKLSALSLICLLVLAVTGIVNGDQAPFTNERSTVARPSTQRTPPSSAALDSIVLAIMAENHTPGCALSVFCTAGFYYTGTYGYAQFEDSIPVTEHTIFGTLSVSKAIAGTALMNAWEDVGFDLDGDISEYLDFSIVHPAYPDSVVTPRMIMTHTSALPHEPWGCWFGMPLCGCLGDVLDPAGSLYEPDDWQDYCPGTGFLYSGTNPCVAACLAEQISGQPFPEYSRAQIFAPLGMVGSAWFGDELDPELVAHAYQWNPEIEAYVQTSENGPNDFRYPAAGFRTSIHDLSRFAFAMMNGGELGGVRILEATTVDSMFTPQYDRVAGTMGLMWFYYDFPSGRYWSHFGGGGTYAAAMMIHESREYGVVLLTNGGGGGLDIVSEALHFMVDDLAGCLVLDSPPSTRTASRLTIQPNPFNPRTAITYEVTMPGAVRLQVYDLRGRPQCILVDGERTVGRHEVAWDGRDDAGRALPSGTYIVRMHSASGVQASKLTLIQ
jgi:CubicO group peptidase (beta-lactamase class C family)